MKTVLLTGARSPAALELARALHRSGIRVLAADSIRFPVCRFSSSVDKTLRHAPARQQPEKFVRDLNRIVGEERIDIIIPTCEETFHLALNKDAIRCAIFAPSIELLNILHDKFQFLDLARDHGISVPRTVVLGKKAELDEFAKLPKIDDEALEELVYKRVFSRFAEGTLVKPSLEQLNSVVPTSRDKWVAQEFIAGQESCCYAVAVDGQLTAISNYLPVHRAGRGAGTYFQPVISPTIEAFVRSLVAATNYTGQISFDFITNKDGATYVIECNPRATSGVHLLEPSADWHHVLGIKSDGHQPTVRAAPTPKMVALAMMLYGRGKDPTRSVLRDIAAARDVTWHFSDPLPSIGQLATMAEFLLISAKRSITPLAATTYDIEWNGND